MRNKNQLIEMFLFPFKINFILILKSVNTYHKKEYSANDFFIK